MCIFTFWFRAFSSTIILNLIQATTGSQWSLRKREVTWDNFSKLSQCLMGKTRPQTKSMHIDWKWEGTIYKAVDTDLHMKFVFTWRLCAVSAWSWCHEGSPLFGHSWLGESLVAFRLWYPLILIALQSPQQSFCLAGSISCRSPSGGCTALSASILAGRLDLGTAACRPLRRFCILREWLLSLWCSPWAPG